MLDEITEGITLFAGGYQAIKKRAAASSGSGRVEAEATGTGRTDLDDETLCGVPRRLFGDDVDGAAGLAGAEQRRIGPLQNLDSLDIEGTDWRRVYQRPVQAIAKQGCVAEAAQADVVGATAFGGDSQG